MRRLTASLSLLLGACGALALCIPLGASAQAALPLPPSPWPNNTNTGYQNAPGYPGSLTVFSGTIKSNTTYRFYRFPTGITIPAGVSNVTFIGCDFQSSYTWNNVVTYGNNISFDYDTFEPSAVSVPPVTWDQGYQYPILQNGGSGLSVNHSNMWGFGNAIQFGISNQSAPVSISNSWFHDLRDPVNPSDPTHPDHQDGILFYTHDSSYIPSYIRVDHNSISALGNTNAVAFQGTTLEHVTVTNNYLSGFGYTVFLGSSQNTNVTFSGNVLGTDFPSVYGPLYGIPPTGNGNVWKCNTIRFVPGTTWATNNNNWKPLASDDGKYWIPTAAYVNPVSSTDYLGNTSCPVADRIFANGFEGP